MIASILAYFTWTAVSGVVGKVWKGFCEFIATPVGAAVVAGFLMFFIGELTEKRINDASWQTKWDTAEAVAEQKRVARDEDIKAKVQADAQSRLAELAASKAELEQKVKAYEDEEAKQLAVGNTGAKPVARCVTDSSDDKWLSDVLAKRAYAKSSVVGGIAKRLRSLGAGSAGAEH